METGKYSKDGKTGGGKNINISTSDFIVGSINKSYCLKIVP